MITMRETAIFLAGAQAYHTISHLWLGLSGLLPLELKVPKMVLTARFNAFATLVNVLLTGVLFWWVSRL